MPADPTRPAAETPGEKRDISAQRELEQIKADLIAVVSHELRTPLTLIRGYLDTLLRPDLTLTSDQQERLLRRTREATDRLSLLIDELLSASQIESGDYPLQCETVDLNQLVRGMLENLAQLGEYRLQATLSDTPLLVWADPLKLEQVLNNLLSNALKFSPPGSAVTVRVEADAAGREALVSVTDQGRGIAPEDQAHLFAKFYRVDNGLSRHTPGIGLGLYISERIVQAHGGQLRLQSQPGKGSTFSFSLPLSDGHPSTDE